MFMIILFGNMDEYAWHTILGETFQLIVHVRHDFAVLICFEVYIVSFMTRESFLLQFYQLFRWSSLIDGKAC